MRCATPAGCSCAISVSRAASAVAPQPPGPSNAVASAPAAGSPSPAREQLSLTTTRPDDSSRPGRSEAFVGWPRLRQSSSRKAFPAQVRTRSRSSRLTRIVACDEVTTRPNASLPSSGIAGSFRSSRSSSGLREFGPSGGCPSTTGAETCAASSGPQAPRRGRSSSWTTSIRAARPSRRPPRHSGRQAPVGWT